MENKRVHFMGIGGAGVSAVAAFANSAGFEISGCDLDLNSPFLNSLKKDSVNLSEGHSRTHLDNVDILVVSPAIESFDPDNQELNSAKDKQIPTLIGEKFLAENILLGKKLIAVSGTHGKSTTTAMIGKIIEDAGLDPSVMVGAVVSDWGTNYRLGHSEYFVLEADEYQEKFLLYKPYISVITSIEMDHPEYFKDFAQIKSAFNTFASQTQKTVIVGEKVDLNGVVVELKVLGKDFQVENFQLKLLGDFNQSNASIAFEVAKILEIKDYVARESLERFAGVGRRFEFKGEVKGIKIFDDYGHHPTAIKATSKAARKKFPKGKIWLVYQPHMFSRTKYLEKEFVEVFKNLPIDQIILVDIFAARQENTEHIKSSDIVSKVDQETVRYLGDFEATADYLIKNLKFGDIVINMGAGDIYKLSEMLIRRLNN